VSGEDGAEVFNLWSGELSNLHVIDGDVVLASGEGVEGVLQLIGGDCVGSDAGHVVDELVEGDEVVTLRDTREDGFENCITT